MLWRFLTLVVGRKLLKTADSQVLTDDPYLYPMSITNLLVAWLFLMAAYLLFMKFREDRLQGKSFFNFGDYNFLVASITVLIVIWASFSLISPEPHFSDSDKQIEFGTKTNQPKLIVDAMWEKIKESPENPDYHFALVQNHFEEVIDPLVAEERNAYEREGARIFNFYADLCEQQTDPELNDIGNLFLAYWYLENRGDDLEAAAFHLRQVKNRKLKYLNYIEGNILLYEIGPDVAENFFLEEIKVNGYKTGAWEKLASIYALTERKTDLKKLIGNPESCDAIPVEYRYEIYFLNGDLLSFYKLRFGQLLNGLNRWGVLGDLLILFTWLFFLRRLSFLSPIKWKHFFLAIGIGSVLAMLSWLLYEFYHHVLHFWTNGEIGNDLLFSFLGIGFIEELAKLIPFLLILKFTKIIKRPVDYLLIASAAGLGFAFFENLLYFSKYGLDVIHSRALTASVSHMVSSAIVAYGFVLAKYRYPGKWHFIPIFFILAVLAHGFYDFWLLNDKVNKLAIVTLFFFLSEILFYVSFLNNSLNQSTTGINHASGLSLNTQKLSAFIAGALILVFALEYTGTCLIYGTEIGNKSLISSFLSGGYLIFFLSVRLSNIDIVPGEWMKIEFFSGILPSEILGGSKKLNYNSVVGLELDFILHPASSTIALQLPFKGIVRRRLKYKGFSGWFIVELENPIQAENSETRIIYIRAKNSGELISKDEETVVGIFIRSGKGGKSNLVFLDWSIVR